MAASVTVKPSVKPSDKIVNIIDVIKDTYDEMIVQMSDEVSELESRINQGERKPGLQIQLKKKYKDLDNLKREKLDKIIGHIDNYGESVEISLRQREPLKWVLADPADIVIKDNRLAYLSLDENNFYYGYVCIEVKLIDQPDVLYVNIIDGQWSVSQLQIIFTPQAIVTIFLSQQHLREKIILEITIKNKFPINKKYLSVWR